MFPGVKLMGAKKDFAAKAKKLGREHPDTLEARDELVVAFFNAGKLAEAEKLGLESIAERDRINGPGTKEALIVAQNLAIIYGSQGYWERGRAMLDGVLANMDATLGPQHETTIHTRLNFAVMLIDQSAMDAELAAFGRQHAERVAETLGTGQPAQRVIAEAIALAATGYEGDPARVAAGCDDTLERALSAIGGDIPFATTAKYYLSLQLAQGERYDAAIRLGQQVLEERLAILGGGAPETMDALANLYFHLEHAGETGAAEALRARFGLEVYDGALMFPINGLRDRSASPRS